MNSTPSFLIAEDGSVPSLSKVRPNPFKVGDILHSAVGYEASISEFHEVVKVSGNSVFLVELDVKRDYKQGGMEWVSTPVLGSGSGQKAFRKVVKNGDRVKINSYRTAWKWDGQPSNDYNYH